MGYAQQLQVRHASIFARVMDHPFVRGIGDGSLPVERFRFYIEQDYAFLIEYSRVLALAVAKGRELPGMGHFAELLHATLNVEMALHRMRRFTPSGSRCMRATSIMGWSRG
jgi:thiaminase/transcriptional activator TenA